METLAQFISIGKGLTLTLGLMIGGLGVGLIGGSLLAVARYKNQATILINGLISLLRGTPVILQLSFVYFSIPGVTGLKLSVFMAGLITLGFNSSAYVAEIIRAGIEALPKGQFEAAKTLYISPWPMWKDIILPQVLRNILPALVNESVSLLKETALISTLGGMDVMRCAQVVASQNFTYFMPLCMAAVYYYSGVCVLSYLGKRLERRFSYA